MDGKGNKRKKVKEDITHKKKSGNVCEGKEVVTDERRSKVE